MNAIKTFLNDKRNTVILLLFALFLIKVPQEDIRFAIWVVLGVFITALSDFIIKSYVSKIRVMPKSGIITGFIVSGIIDSGQNFIVLMSFCVFSVLLKYIFRYRNRHIFNPASFSLSITSLFGIPLTWQIESNIFIIITVGLYLAYAIRKLPHIFGFLFFFIILFHIQGINPFNLISWFFYL